jgi:hypothetical protein
MNIPDGAGPSAPENRQYFEFGVSGSRQWLVEHIRRTYYEVIRMSTGHKTTNTTTDVKSNRDITWGFQKCVQVASISQAVSVIKREVQA